MNDDHADVQNVLAGNTEAFRPLVDRYQGRVYRLALAMTHDAHTAEDLAQEAFVRAFRSLDRFDRKRGSFSTWLYTIARNLTRNHIAKMRPVTLADPPEPHDPRSPDTSAVAREELRQLDDTLAKLPTDQRTAFHLAEIEGLPLAEVARIEQTAVGTIKSRVSRARAALRASIERHHPA